MVVQGKRHKAKGKNGFKNKALTLRFLSLCFAYPNNAFLPNLRKRLQEITGETEKAEFTSLLRLFEQENQEQLQGEYTRLFITGYPTTPCPPYESYFLEGRLLGLSSTKVQAVYDDWCMTCDPSLVDHLSTELEFLAFLASAATLGDTSNEACKAYELFIRNHLSQWLPDFCKTLKEHSSFSAYRTLATLLSTSIPSTLL